MACVGYAGMEAFDIILYMGQTLTKLGYPVLIIDLSDTKALTKAIYHGMDIDSKDTIVHYRSLNYIRRIPQKKELDDFSDGVILVSFGLQYIDSLPLSIDIMNIVVNSVPSSIERVNAHLNNSNFNNSQLRLLIRDIITLDDVERIKRNISVPNISYSSNYLYLELIDYENAIKCQISQVVNFKRISSRMKRFIVSEIENLLPNMKLSRIRRAAFLARKGGA